MSGKRCGINNDNLLDLAVDKLEDRLMLAVDVSVSGQNVTVVGDDGANGVEIYEKGGTIRVNGEDTGLTSINKLKIVMKDSGDVSEPDERRLAKHSGDYVEISNDIRVTGKTTIKLGNGPNSLYFGGLHNKVKIAGGKGSDYVALVGGIGTSKNVVSLKGGDDTVVLDAGEYLDAAFSDTPLNDYLQDIPLDESSLSLIPSIKGKLGGGNDRFSVEVFGEEISDSDLLDGINDLASEFDLGPFSTLEEAAEFVTTVVDDLGIRIPQFVSLNGGGGIDAMNSEGTALIIDLIGSHKKFEEFGPSA